MIKFYIDLFIHSFQAVLIDLLRKRQWTTFNEEIRKKPALSDYEKFTIFSTACAKPRIDCSCVETLIEAGFFARLQQEKDTCAYYSICDGRLDILRLLVNHSPDLLEFVDEDGNTLLHYAASSGHLEVAEFLLERFSMARINAMNVGRKSALDEAGLNQQMAQLIRKYKGGVFSRFFFRK